MPQEQERKNESDKNTHNNNTDQKHSDNNVSQYTQYEIANAEKTIRQTRMGTLYMHQAQGTATKAIEEFAYGPISRAEVLSFLTATKVLETDEKQQTEISNNNSNNRHVSQWTQQQQLQFNRRRQQAPGPPTYNNPTNQTAFFTHLYKEHYQWIQLE